GSRSHDRRRRNDPGTSALGGQARPGRRRTPGFSSTRIDAVLGGNCGTRASEPAIYAEGRERRGVPRRRERDLERLLPQRDSIRGHASEGRYHHGEQRRRSATGDYDQFSRGASAGSRGESRWITSGRSVGGGGAG